jgi:hypothetical protein
MRKIFGLVVAPIVGISSLLVASPSFTQGWRTLPSHNLTPGLTRGLTVKKICNTKWGSDARLVTSKMKKDEADGAHKKDRLEPELHRRVCKAKSAALLKRYQNKIKTNWISLYHEIYGNQ